MGLFLGPVLLAVFKAGLNVFSRYDFTAAGAESDRAVKTGEPLAEDSSPSATD